MDTIVTKPSTVPEAGQGAFATRKMPVGSVISVTPMITVSNAALAMDVPYTRQENTPQIQEDPELSKDMYIPQMRKNSTQQLLKNYCFGHTKSDLLLCPTTQAALINHADVSARPQQEPNVRIRWHMDTENDKEHFILQPLASITNINHTDLSSYRTRIVIEYVATRDIEFGDELLMDYTSEWQLALYSHLEHGHSTPRDVDPNHIPAKLRNDMGQPIELSEDVRPKHLAFLCDVHPNIHIVDGTTPSWEDFDSNSAVHKESWSEHFRLWFGHNEAASLYPCNVIGTDRFQNMYEIVMLVKPLVNAQVGRMFRNVPGHRIRYADSLYQSDMHLEWAFRYHIPIADANFPLQWRRDYKSAENWNLGKHMNGKQANASEESYEETLRQAKCGLYLARSNIPNAGFGLYTAVDIPGAGILVSTFASAIPAFAPQQGHHQGQHWPGKDYTWSSIGFDAASHEAWPKFVVSMLVGLVGALVNGHAGIINLEHDIGDWEPAIDGTKHHGAGGFSDYINSGFRSRYAIAAGEELFASYGEHWFHGRSQFAKMPLFHNYRDANRILASVWAFLSTESIIDSDDFVSKLLTLIPQYFVQKDNIRTKSALNIIQTMDALRRVVARNGTAEVTISPRSKEWLDATGYCQDHIYVKTSTIPDAGKGAFTRRFIPKGSLLLASPTIATRRELLHFDSSGFGRSTNEFQLMTNYHFGHTSSSALFFPLTQATAINHNSARLTNGKEPNARIQFSTSDKRSMYFQSLSLEDILEVRISF